MSSRRLVAPARASSQTLWATDRSHGTCIHVRRPSHVVLARDFRVMSAKKRRTSEDAGASGDAKRARGTTTSIGVEDAPEVGFDSIRSIARDETRSRDRTRRCAVCERDVIGGGGRARDSRGLGGETDDGEARISTRRETPGVRDEAREPETRAVGTMRAPRRRA